MEVAAAVVHYTPRPIFDPVSSQTSSAALQTGAADQGPEGQEAISPSDIRSAGAALLLRSEQT